MIQHKKKGITVVAGTFGHLHKGHMALLQRAVSTRNMVIVGVTSDDYVKKTKNYAVPPYEERTNAVRVYLEAKRADFIIKPLENNSGDADRNEDYKDIVVSKETEKSAIQLNQKRKSNGLKPLRILAVNTKIANDFFVLSSTRIDRGEIDGNGARILPLKVLLIISENIKSGFKDTIIRSVFKGSPMSVRIEAVKANAFPEFSKLKRAYSGKIEDFDYLAIISEHLLPYLQDSRNMICIRSFVLDRYGITGEGFSSSIEMADSFYYDFVRGKKGIDLFASCNNQTLGRMIRESLTSSLELRKKPWETGFFDQIQSV